MAPIDSIQAHQDVLLSCLQEGPVAVALFDPSDALRYANPSYLTLFGLDGVAAITFEQIMQRCFDCKCGLIIETDNFPAWMADVQQRRRQVRQRSFQADFYCGRWIWVEETLRDDGWLAFVGSEITTLKNSELALRYSRDAALQEANTDALTSLCNRRFGLSVLSELIQQCRTHAKPAVAGILDLDHFKSINDTRGHPFGDQVLRHFANTSKSALRPGDLMCRIGGEEFLLLIPGSGIDNARGIVERLRALLAGSEQAESLQGFKYTFSAGLTELQANDSQESVLARADGALYRAKKDGRNRCVVAA